ncbi:MAG: hypothetical protein QOJ65_559 [Fimbriimonadaceae bacterium]|jgi:hypothetical protein|nr:hypothetical protein [Fimbriimonadaceae bacterium]
MIALVVAALAVMPRIAVLPVINCSDEPSGEFRQQMAESAATFLPRGFAANGFVVVPKEETEAAITAAKVDLTDEETYRRETFLKVGQASHADYVYFATIESNSFLSANTGRVTICVWFLGVGDGRRILSSRRVRGQSKERLGGGPMRTQVVAAARAAEESVKLIVAALGATYQAPGP